MNTDDAAQVMLYDNNMPALEQYVQSNGIANVQVTMRAEEDNDIVSVIISTKDGPTTLLCSRFVLPQIINAFIGQRA